MVSDSHPVPLTVSVIVMDVETHRVGESTNSTKLGKELRTIWDFHSNFHYSPLLVLGSEEGLEPVAEGF